MLSSFKKSPVEQETIGCYSIFQVGSLSNYYYYVDIIYTDGYVNMISVGY